MLIMVHNVLEGMFDRHNLLTQTLRHSHFNLFTGVESKLLAKHGLEPT